MKLRIVSMLLILTGCFLGSSYFTPAHTHVAGAPAARCGSIADPLTCSNCHAGGTNVIMDGWITSDIPASGYLPGMTYNIVATATLLGRVRFGFEISPQSQNIAGTYLGTMIDTSSQTKIISTKYITHTSAGTTGTDSKTWAFNWTAPSTAIDSVTFYGAFLCANNNSTSSGDATYRSRLTVYRDITAGLEDDASNSPVISVYPVPASDHLYVNYKNSYPGQVEMSLFDQEGSMIVPLISEYKTSGNQSDLVQLPFGIANGIYFLQISAKTSHALKKILIQH